MIPRFRLFLFTVVATTFSVTPLAGQQRVPLDHSVYDGWNRISARAISNDGRWVLYRVTPGLGDSKLHVRNIESGQTFEIDRGNAALFSQDSRFVVFEIQPGDSIVKDMRLKKTKPADLPKDSLGILDLTGGSITRVERVKSFAMPAEASGWVAYLMEAPTEEASDSSEAEGRQDGAFVLQRAQSDDNGDKKEEGTQLVVRNLATGAESRFEDVAAFAFAENGSRLAYTASNEEGDADGVFVVTPGSDTAEPLMVGKGVYKNLALADEGDQVAFLGNRDDFEADQPAFALYHWERGDDEASAVADGTTRGVPAGWWVSENGTPAFSENGERLFFGTAPRPAPDPEEEVPEWEEVVLDVWNWKDPLLQPNQLVQRQRELERTYRAVVDLDENSVVQLATIAMPTVTVADSGNGDIALAVTNMRYRQQISWDSPGYNDVYVVDVSDGRARLLLEEIQASAQLSPAGKYLTWWDGNQRAWFAKGVDRGEAVNLTGAIAYPLYNELHDRPMLPGSNGSAGWTADDERFLVYDKHDIWAVDPTGRDAPRNITEGVGRRENLRFRYVALDRSGGFAGFGGFGGGGGGNVIADNENIVLSAFDLTSKSSGFYRDRVRGDGEPRRIVMEPHRFGTPQKARDADVVIFTRESFREFPDLWASDLTFDDTQRLSHANPQQGDYLWGSAELVDWTSTDGLPLQGLLFKPDNFDPNRKYPMMVYYYEKNSENLHRHRAPSPGSSSIDISLYVSRGYVVFIPDIFYRDGYPGESALNCLVPGVLSIIAKGFIDPDRVGAQGHSWGGYQNAYLVTRTNIFAAVEAGAPVSNMTSAYGGIRWQTGLSRAMQYEKTQSRLGGSLWEVRPRYIENSPVFWADKIETPVLMMHNDEDGAVPWYQGIEFFVALRRLQKPVWMLNYNGEAHGLRKYQNRKDFAVRMLQFFDHYLMGVPAPVWMEEGIPAVNKGKDLGLEVKTKTVTSGGGR